MASQPNQGEIRPFVAELHGEIRTTSLKVAEHFGKRHDDVLKRIRKLECSEEFRLRNFAETSQDIPQPTSSPALPEPRLELLRMLVPILDRITAGDVTGLAFVAEGAVPASFRIGLGGSCLDHPVRMLGQLDILRWELLQRAEHSEWWNRGRSGAG